MTEPDKVPSRPADRTVMAGGVPLRRGSRVRLRPGRRTDVFDLALTGRTAEVAAIEEDMEGRIHVVVTLDGDVGSDFTTGLGHRFFFSPEELEPLGAAPGAAAPGNATAAGPRILVAGIGNVFMADDGFGPEVVSALHERTLPEGVHAADFGIRGMDLAYRLLDGYDAAVLVDAAPRGGPPGTLYVIEPEPEDHTGEVPAAHGMDPVQVLALARRLAGRDTLPRIVVLGCEPMVRMNGDEPDVVVGLSAPVQAAVDEAVRLLESLLGELLRDTSARLEAPVGRR